MRIEPFALCIEDELPVKKLPDVVDWSENYAFIGYDFNRHIGFCAYIGRWVKNPSVWREQLYLYLPDGSILSHTGMGKSATDGVITAGCLALQCLEAGGTWQIDFDGPMRRDTLDQLCTEPVNQRSPINVQFNVTIDHRCPVWMFPRADNSTFGKFHYEQMGVSRGTLAFAGTTLSFEAPTYRDHTRGPRNLSHYNGHIWLQLHFPNGPSFSTYHMWHDNNGKPEQILDLGTSVRPGELLEAKLLNSPRLSSPKHLGESITVQIEMEGRLRELTGRPLSTLAYSFSRDVEFFYGLVPSVADFYSIEQPLLFETAEGPVPGYIQRSGPFNQ
jgi:hypothetical protein